MENLFESEDSSECTEAACATQFEVCPGIASETSDNENFATFLDCSCGCKTSTASSEVEFSKRSFFCRIDGGVFAESLSDSTF